MDTDTHPNRKHLRRRRAGLAGMIAAAGTLWVVACGSTEPRGTGPTGQLLVVSPGDETVTRIDGATGRLVARVPVGPGAWQVTGAPGGALFVLSIGAASGQGAVRQVARSGATWMRREVELEPGAGARLLAGDGGATIVVVYGVPAAAGDAGPGPAAGACRLAVVDGRTGAVRRRFTVCDAAREGATAAAVWSDDGAVVALAVERHAGDPGRPPPSGARVLVVDLRTGAAVAAATLPGAAAQLVVGAAPQTDEGVLDGVQAIPPVPHPAPWDDDPARWRWQLLALRLPDLAPVGDWPLPHALRWLAVAPDGGHAYALADGYGTAPDTRVLGLDLRTGSWTTVHRAPGAAAGLAVFEHRIYVAGFDRAEVWALDRHTGGPLGGTRLSAPPVWLTLARP